MTLLLVRRRSDKSSESSGSSLSGSAPSPSVSVLREARNRRSISFQPPHRTVRPLAVNSFPAQVKEAVTASYTWGAATAQRNLQAIRDSSFFSLSASPVKPCLINSAVGMMAWWSLTLALFNTGRISGVSSTPSMNGSRGRSPVMVSAAVCSMSSVKNRLSVRG